MFYLATHSTHCILRLYGVGHMVKDHSDSEMKPAAATWATLSDYQQGFFSMHHPTDMVAHTTVFVTPVMEHWLEREIAQWVHPMKDRSDDPSNHERTLLPLSYISLQNFTCMYVCMYICMYVCMYACMYACTYLRMYACVCVCVCVCYLTILNRII